MSVEGGESRVTRTFGCVLVSAYLVGRFRPHHFEQCMLDRCAVSEYKNSSVECWASEAFPLTPILVGMIRAAVFHSVSGNARGQGCRLAVGRGLGLVH